MSPSRPDPASRRPAVDASEISHILRFASHWHRFGGGSVEDIFVQFGVDKTTFGRRVLAALDAAGAAVDPTLAAQIRAAYRRQLAPSPLAGSPRAPNSQPSMTSL